MRTLLLTTAVLAAVGCAATAEDTKVNVLEGKMKGIDGKDVDLAQYKGKVVLFVNVASACGYTGQYTGLQALYEKHGKDGLVVVGVPSNEFGAQEPGSDAEIKEFCSTKYKVTFPMLSKVSVKGTGKVPLYKGLVGGTANKKEVGWNFEKFLVNRKGEVVARFGSGVEPNADELMAAVKKALDEK